MGERIRSQEDEAALDRKIAEIREKNEKIQQRAKEIEADRLQANGGVDSRNAQKKNDKNIPNSNSGGKTGNGWNREWDKGKTPAEQWRENVPSMELTDRKRYDGDRGGGGGGSGGGGGGDRTSGGAGGRKRSDGNRSNQTNAHHQVGRNERSTQNHRESKKSDGPNLGGRLAGRISFDKERTSIEKMASSKTNGPPNGPANHSQNGRSDRNGKNLKKTGGDFKIEIKSFEGSKDQPRGGRRTRSGGELFPSRETNNNEQNKKPRQRRESDNHAVKNVLYQLVNRVVKEARREERLNNNQNLETSGKSENQESRRDGEGREKTPEETASTQSSKGGSPDVSSGASSGLSSGDSGDSSTVSRPVSSSPVQETKLSLVTESLVRPIIA